MLVTVKLTILYSKWIHCDSSFLNNHCLVVKSSGNPHNLALFLKAENWKYWQNLDFLPQLISFFVVRNTVNIFHVDPCSEKPTKLHAMSGVRIKWSTEQAADWKWALGGTGRCLLSGLLHYSTTFMLACFFIFPTSFPLNSTKRHVCQSLTSIYFFTIVLSE